MSLNWGNKRKVIKNLKSFCRKTKINLRNRAHVRPEHGNRVLHVNERNIDAIESKGIRHDGLITRCKNIALTLAAADCYPVALTDKKGSFASLLHVGQKGAEAKIVAKTIKIIKRRFNVVSENIVLTIGPGIRACCYNVNLVKLIKRQARSRGIPRENIVETDATCTCCGKDGTDKHIYFSHRRSVKNVKEEEGRSITIVSLLKKKRPRK